MVKELIYKLNNPNYTIYHRAALGGLAATVQAWKKNPPVGINTELTKDQVRLFWDDAISDQEALQRILAASFKLTKDKMIDLPGHGITEDKYGLRLAIHNGIAKTFLQHNQAKKGKEFKQIQLKVADEETGLLITYKAIDSYAHQQAKGTDLLSNKDFPNLVNIPQWVVPGAIGDNKLDAPYQEVILLFFLMVGCSYFLLKRHFYDKEKAQFCIVIPDVIDLLAFAKALHRIAQAGTDLKRFSNTYLNRVVGGAEEAALRFLIDLQTENITNERSVKGCQAIAMGKVAWDKKQVNRSISISLEDDYPELEIFQAAYTYLNNRTIIKTEKGERYAVPTSPIPELIAANLAAKRHWASHFINLVSDKKDFNNMRYSQGGLVAMKDSIKDEEDKLIIQVFQEAWKFIMRGLYERAEREKTTDPERLLETERERMRNAILRTKNVDALSNWFLRFCADATKGNSLSSLAENSSQVRNFIFNQRNFERFQNLCLFALLSYKSDSKTTSGGKN